MEEKPKKNCLKKISLTRKKKALLNLMNLIIFGSLLFLIIFSSGIVEASRVHTQERDKIIEQVWRTQQRVILNDHKSQFLLAIYSGEIDYNSKESVYKWAEKNISGIRIGGPTGDVFIIDLSDEQILFNLSPDLGKPVRLNPPIYLEDTIPNFADPESAERIFDEMRKLYSTNVNSNNSWNYDGSEEFLEWIIIPSDSLGWGGVPPFIDGEKNPNYKAYLIVSGVQKDEILKPYAELDKQCVRETNKLIFLNYFLTIGGIVFIFWFFYLETRHDQ